MKKGEAVDIIHDDVVMPSPMLDEVIDEASLLQYTPPPSPIIENESGAVIEQKMDQEAGAVMMLFILLMLGLKEESLVIVRSTTCRPECSIGYTFWAVRVLGLWF